MGRVHFDEIVAERLDKEIVRRIEQIEIVTEPIAGDESVIVIREHSDDGYRVEGKLYISTRTVIIAIFIVTAAIRVLPAQQVVAYLLDLLTNLPL